MAGLAEHVLDRPSYRTPQTGRRDVLSFAELVVAATQTQ